MNMVKMRRSPMGTPKTSEEYYAEKAYPEALYIANEDAILSGVHLKHPDQGLSSEEYRLVYNLLRAWWRGKKRSAIKADHGVSPRNLVPDRHLAINPSHMESCLSNSHYSRYRNVVSLVENYGLLGLRIHDWLYRRRDAR